MGPPRVSWVLGTPRLFDGIRGWLVRRDRARRSCIGQYQRERVRALGGLLGLTRATQPHGGKTGLISRARWPGELRANTPHALRDAIAGQRAVSTGAGSKDTRAGPALRLAREAGRRSGMRRQAHAGKHAKAAHAQPDARRPALVSAQGCRPQHRGQSCDRDCDQRRAPLSPAPLARPLAASSCAARPWHRAGFLPSGLRYIGLSGGPQARGAFVWCGDSPVAASKLEVAPHERVRVWAAIPLFSHSHWVSATPRHIHARAASNARERNARTLPLGRAHSTTTTSVTIPNRIIRPYPTALRFCGPTAPSHHTTRQRRPPTFPEDTGRRDRPARQADACRRTTSFCVATR